MANIGKNIRLLRSAQNMTQDQLAEALHMTRQTVSNYETGKSQPDIDTIVRLAEALQTDPNALIYGIPTPPERKREILHAVIAAGAALILAVAYLFFKRPVAVYTSRTWDMTYSLLVGFFYRPLMYLVMGYAAMQILSLLGGLKPRHNGWWKWVLLVFLAVYLLTVLFGWYLPDVLPEWKWFRFHIASPFVEFAVTYAQIFILPGAGLWLFRTKQKN